MKKASPLKRIRQWINGTTQRRLVFWSAGFWLISIVLLALVFLQTGQNQTLAETKERNVQQASSISRDINIQIGNVISNTRTFTQYLGESDPNLAAQAGDLVGLRLSSARYKAIYYFDTNDALLLYLTESTENLLAIKNPASLVNRPPVAVRNEIEDAYRNAQQNGFYMSGVSISPLDYAPVLYIGEQITFPGETRIIVFEIDLTDIWQGIDLATVGQTGITYAVSKDGIVITHPQQEFIGREMPAALNPVLSGQEGSVQLLDPFTEQVVIAAYSPVGGQTGWGIIVQQNKAEIYSAIVKTGTTIIIILTGLWLIGTLSIVFLMGSFTRPIKQLTKTTRDIAVTGDLTKTGLTERSDEVGQLSQAFDQMIDKVKDTEGKLASSEERYRSLFEHAHDAIFLVYKHGIIDCNRKAEELFGIPRDQLIHKIPSQLSPLTQPDGGNSHQKEQELVTRSFSGELLDFEWQFQRSNDELFDVEVSLNRVKIDDDYILMAIVRDITERKRAQEDLKKAYAELENRVEQRTGELKEANGLLLREIAQRQEAENLLQQSEAKYRDLVENSASIILEWDPDGKITFLNKYGQQFFGYTEQEILGRNVVGTIVPQTGSAGDDVGAKISEVLKNPELYENNENENIKSNGERVWIAWTNKGIFDRDGVLRLVHSIGIDRTAQMKAAATQQEKAKEEAAAFERTRLARDLHDAVSQTLFSASIIADVLPKLWEKNQEEGRRRLEEIRQLTRGALAEMRTLLFELRPAALADAEFSYLLHQLAESITGRTRITVKVHVEGQCELPADLKVALYRITQEALNNVAKHAGASQANINVTCEAGVTMLTISDNGRGFDKENVRAGSLGLGIMQDRAKEIGAELTVESSVGSGTVISIKVKEDEEPENDAK